MTTLSLKSLTMQIPPKKICINGRINVISIIKVNGETQDIILLMPQLSEM